MTLKSEIWMIVQNPKKLNSKKIIFVLNLTTMNRRKRHKKKLASFERSNYETNEIFIMKEEIAIIKKRHLMIQTILIHDIRGSS